MRKAWSLLLLLPAVLVFCQTGEKKSGQEIPFGIGRVQGELDYKKIDEASGLAAGRVNPDMLWTHNDSGDKARIFLIDTQGRYQATLWLQGAYNRDWEDIAAGPGPEPGVHYLYVGDIGDNTTQYPYKIIYRLPEPAVDKTDIQVTSFDSIRFSLPDGIRDAEALMVDPSNADIYIFSKREKAINLYRLPYPQSTEVIIEAELFISELPFSSVVAADWSADGNEILLKTYKHVYYWERHQDETLAETLLRKPIELPYREEPQGESIAFDLHGRGYYTLSEKSKKTRPALMFYPRKRTSK